MWPADGSLNVLMEMKVDKINTAELCLWYKLKSLHATSSNFSHFICPVFTSNPNFLGTKDKLSSLVSGVLRSWRKGDMYPASIIWASSTLQKNNWNTLGSHKRQGLKNRKKMFSKFKTFKLYLHVYGLLRGIRKELGSSVTSCGHVGPVRTSSEYKLTFT